MIVRTIAVALVSIWASTPAAASTDWVRAPDGVPLCVYETGNPKGPAILFLHGFSQTHAVFKRQFDSGLARDYRLIGTDLRGHGCSGKPWDPAAYASTEIWAKDLDAVLRAKQVDRVLIVAWSFGAYVVADYVRTFGRGALAGAVFVGSTAALLPPEIDPAATRRRAAPPAAGSPIEASQLEIEARGAGTFVSLMSHRPMPLDLAAIMRDGALQLPAYASRAMTQRILRNDDLVESMVLPLRLFVGAHDRANPPALMDQLAAQLPEAAVQEFEQSGHSPFAEEPQEFNAALTTFARSVLTLLGRN